MEIFTIGFTQSSAAGFFERLKQRRIQRLVDVRLNNTSQLAGFAKRDDLIYFLREVCQIDYLHEPQLAPTQEMLDAYKKHKGDWADYERAFLQLITDRRIEAILNRGDFEQRSVLLCSEAQAEHCHRRLVAEYLASKWPAVEIVHL